MSIECNSKLGKETENNRRHLGTSAAPDATPRREASLDFYAMSNKTTLLTGPSGSNPCTTWLFPFPASCKRRDAFSCQGDHVSVGRTDSPGVEGQARLEFGRSSQLK